jgi:hypothetical protein
MKTKAYVSSFGDYHDIDEHTDHLPKGWKGKEVAFDRDYWGLFWTGIKPKREEIKSMLEKEGFCSEDPEDFYP